MVNKRTTGTNIINRYEFIRMTDDSVYQDAIEFCPYSGKECNNAFLWETQHQVCNILMRNNQEELLTGLFEKN